MFYFSDDGFGGLAIKWEILSENLIRSYTP